MKHVKKLLAVVLSAALAMAMCVCAFADESTPANPTIKMASNANGNTYSVYKIFDAEKIDNSDMYRYTLPTNSPFAGFFGADKTYNLNAQGQIIETADGGVVFGNPAVNTGAESDNRWDNTNSTKTAALAAALANYARSNNIAATDTLTNANAKEFALGYYLVVETASGNPVDNNTSSEVATKPILVDLTKGNAEITPKNESVNLDKVIVEEDNSEVEANSAQIGDDIGYKVTTITPKYEANVNEKALKFVLSDTFSDGLTYKDGSMKVFAGGTELAEAADTYKIFVDGQNVKVVFAKSWLKANQATAITLKYSATLNANAKVNDTAGNPNTITLNYSNNPGQVSASDVENLPDIPENPDTPDGIPTKELEDKVVTYSYGIDIIKVDGKDNHELPSAEFTIADASGTLVEFVKVDETDAGVVYRVATDDDTNTVTTLAANDASGKIIVKGLDAETYSLTETKAPDEYTVLADSIKVKIEEKIDTIDQTVKVTEYAADGTVIDSHNETVQVTGPTGEATYTVDSVAVIDTENHKTGEATADENGSIAMNVYVPNEKGLSMPETGSRTAMYCMIGGAAVIVLGAAYYLIGARRNRKEQ